MNLKLAFLIFLIFIEEIICLNKRADCKCRILAAKRIVNGRTSHRLAFPFYASLSYNKFRKANRTLKKLLPDNIKTSGLTCSATILNRNFLITAAVCLTSNLSLLTIGLNHDNDLIKMFDDDHIPIKRTIVHPKFIKSESDEKDFSFNLALIELEKPIEFGNSISPACLAVSKRNKSLIYSNLQAAGWGATFNKISLSDGYKSNFLKEIDLVDKSDETDECLKNSKLMCTKSLNKKDRLTLNDLGGSIVHTLNGKSFVVSILSYLNIEIDKETETAYFSDLSFSSRLLDSIDWIQSHIGHNYCSNE